MIVMNIVESTIIILLRYQFIVGEIIYCGFNRTSNNIFRLETVRPRVNSVNKTAGSIVLLNHSVTVIIIQILSNRGAIACTLYFLQLVCFVILININIISGHIAIGIIQID